MIGDAFAHVKLYMSQFDKDLGLNNLKAFKDAMTANQKSADDWDSTVGKVPDTSAVMRADLNSNIRMPPVPEARKTGESPEIATNRKNGLENLDLENLLKENEQFDKAMRERNLILARADEATSIISKSTRDFDKNLSQQTSDMDLAKRLLEEHTTAMEKFAGFQVEVNRLLAEHNLTQKQANELLDEERDKLNLVYKEKQKMSEA